MNTRFFPDPPRLPSLSLEVGMRSLGFFHEHGRAVNFLQLTFARSGGANATLNCIAQAKAVRR
jgi:hypothetical protein